MSNQKTKKPIKPLKVALVCDWLISIGGAERVLKSIQSLYPDAPIYTSQYRPSRIDWFKDTEVKTGWLNYFPTWTRYIIGPLRQFYFNHLDLSDYDLIISVTGAEAKSVLTQRGTNGKKALHICYCHVPTQYYWGKYEDYLKNPGFGFLNPIMRLGLKLLVAPARLADLKAAARPDFYLTDSHYAAAEIKKYYNREATVLNPPVSVEIFQQSVENSKTKIGNCQEKKSTNQTTKNQKSQTEKSEQPSQPNSTSVENSQSSVRFSPPLSPEQLAATSPYFINFSRQVSWKRLDLAIKACLKTKQHLVLIGDGPLHPELVSLAQNSPLIHFFPPMTQPELKNYLRFAKAFIFPSEEPFGIAPVEAIAAGCPVLAFSRGGAQDYLIPGKNGLFFDRQSVNSLVETIEKFNQLPPLSPTKVSNSATKFSESHFKSTLQDFIDEKLQ